jgi:hypothetical protein
VQKLKAKKKAPRCRFLTDMLVARAKALAKHRHFVEDIRSKIDDEKRARVAKYEEEHKATIRDYDFKPEALYL